MDSYISATEYLAPLQQALPWWLEEIKKKGIAERAPIVDDDMGRFLKLICSLKQPKSILEIGCGLSYSTHWMLWGYKDSRIVAIDYNKDRLRLCEKFLKISGFLDRVELTGGWAEDFFLENNRKFDMIFQDSAKKGYTDMIESCYQALNPGGLLVADNIFYNNKTLGLAKKQEKKYAKGVAALKRFNKQMAEHPGFESEFFPLSDGALTARRVT